MSDPMELDVSPSKSLKRKADGSTEQPKKKQVNTEQTSKTN